MLRALITIYKTLFLISCGLMLVGCVLVGIGLMIHGDTPQQRQFGLKILVGGTLLTIMTAGSSALMIENNQLLRKIAEGTPSRGDRQQDVSQPRRKEPTFSDRQN